MPTVRTRRRYDPDGISDQVYGKFPLRLVRLCIQELYGLIGAGAGSNTTVISGGSGTPGSTSSASRFTVEWRANGPYRVDTDVDGAWIVPVACDIESIYLWRGTPGSSGETVIDLNRRHITEAPSLSATLYVNQDNRPTIAYDDSDYVVPANLPDIVSLQAGDVVTIDCDERESGRPYDFVLALEAVAA